MVAKSYQGLELVAEPYAVNGRMYVKVKTQSGTVRQVRWYNAAEYKKMYPDAVVDHSEDPYWRSQKDVLGFGAGFITIFTGDNTYEHKEWFREIGCTYRKFWGWALAGDKEVPAILPAGITAIRLDWDLVGKEDETLKTDEAVRKAVESLTYEPSPSEYQGAVGDRIEVTLTVDKNIEVNGYYGSSNMHIMSDANGNVYVWTTASKSWSEGSVKTIRGTIKDHREYRNTKQTVLTRCSEVKK